MKENFELADLIKNARKKAGLTQLELAEKLGVTQGTVGQYETRKGETNHKGDNKKSVYPSLDKLPELAKILGISIIDFFPNARDNRKQLVKYELKNNMNNYVSFLPNDPQDIIYIDSPDMKLGAGAEGTFDLELFNTDRKIGIDRRFITGLNPANLKIFSVVGDSMEPEYKENDLAIVDMVNCRYNFVKIPGIYMVRLGDVVYIKRVEFLPNNGLKLISLNKQYGDILPHKEGYDYEILGKICGKIHYEIAKGLTFDDAGIR